MSEVEQVKRIIAGLPLESQLRVSVVVGILRELLEKDQRQEVELAFTLVMAELAI